MLSLPLIIPRDDNTLWPASRPQQQPPHNHSHSQQSQHQRRAAAKPLHARPLSLPHLQADENLLDARKQNVKRFGAGWLRPPGVAKTLQALQDEAQERRDQEEAQRREQALMEQMAAEEERAAREGLLADGEEEEERDLDEEIPEADEEEDEEEDEDEDSDEEDEDEDESDQDVTFEESALEGSVGGSDIQRRLELEEAEMTGAAEEARDLDDDVPEAGSYEHTDSEIEDSSDEADVEERDLDDDIPEAPGDVSMAEASGMSADLSAHSARHSARSSAGHRVSGHSFLSDTGSSVPGSSFLDTSPVAGRGRGDPSAHARRAQAMERMQTRVRRFPGSSNGRGA